MSMEGENAVNQPGICLGPRCGDYGGLDLLAALRERGIRAQGIDCQSLCQASPVVRLPDYCLLRASLEDVLQEMV
ncbi:MAG TPA: (2Fe-2S) ferredoxin domain-containing protein [Mariprofundaceae bacterium]|nr:(2Fe-2S) ferredoxin domain-containing protein [Mariprofundaceae bacterium]